MRGSTDRVPNGVERLEPTMRGRLVSHAAPDPFLGIDPRLVGWEMELPRFRGLVRTFGSCRRLAVLEFIAHRRLVVERGVPTVRVVPALEEVEDRDPRLGRGREAPRSRSSHSRVAKKLSQRALS